MTDILDGDIDYIRPPTPRVEDLLADFDPQTVLDSLPGDWPYPPRDYQCLAYKEIQQEIRDYKAPFIVKAAVSAGKSLIFAMMLRRIRDISARSGVKAMLLCRQGEIVEQDRDEAQLCGVHGSTMCASLGDKSSYLPIVFGSSGTVVNALKPGGQMEDTVFRYLMIDECHHVDHADIINSENAVIKLSDEELLQGVSRHNDGDPAEVTVQDMINNGRSTFTIIIRELQRRCLQRYGKPLVIFGMTGSDYRGITPIVNTNPNTPGFWRRKILDIDTKFLVSRNFVVPTVFGSAGVTYDLGEFQSRGLDGDAEFTAEEFAEMERKILASGTRTQEIMLDVIKQTANRNAVLVTCAGKRHCEEAAAALPPGISYAIVTDDMPAKERRKVLKRAKLNRIKIIFQVGCLTTGINCPPWDTIVIMRRVGSLTLIEQLIGRGQRLLQQIHLDMGMVKKDNLVLDYAGTMADLSQYYFSDDLDEYVHSTTPAASLTVACPKCREAGVITLNSEHARRCIGIRDHKLPDGSIVKQRCDYMFQYTLCVKFVHEKTGEVIDGCMTKNDITSRYCKKCGLILIDPNKNLKKETFEQQEFYKVESFEFAPNKNNPEESISCKYVLSDKHGKQFVAYEILYPLNFANKPVRAKFSKRFLPLHVPDPKVREKILRRKSIKAIMEFADEIRAPSMTTHTKNESGFSSFGHKLFNEESEEF